jgi:hypothetical protein
MPSRARPTYLTLALIALTACTPSPTGGGPSPDASATADTAAADAAAIDVAAIDAAAIDAASIDVTSIDAASIDAASIDAALDAAIDATPDAGPGVRGGPCTGSSDCAGDLAGRVCLVASGTSAGRCVECAPGTMCPDGVTVCNLRASCDNRCATGADCASGSRCDAATNTCARCLSRADCPGALRYCNRAANRCDDGCGSDPDCAGTSVLGLSLEHCASDLARPSCVQCVIDAHCPAGQRCSEHRCVDGCSSTSTCPAGTACCGGGCVDLGTSLAHCGACDRGCAPAPGAAPRCAGGVCGGGPCFVGLADCDGDRANGCEVDTASRLDHCGACGARCPAYAHSVPSCEAGSCATTCAAGFADCDGNVDNGCEVELATSVLHCGACGRACPGAPGAAPACAGGVCGVGACLAGFADCDGDRANGCEVDTRSLVDHCGACGVRCPRYVNSAATCAAGSCATACLTGFADCDGNVDNGCEVELGSALLHCGACGRSCSFAHGSGRCDVGACTLTGCDGGYTLAAGACVLTNVCAVGNGGCDANATCAPVAPGERTCTCNSGYVGDGLTCAPESTCSPACSATQSCVNRLCITTGQLRVTLVWDVAGDVDLHVVPPGGAELYYNSRTSAGGRMERDDTTGTGPENIYWAAAPPAGTYLVCVVPYRITPPISFAVTVNRPGVPAIRYTGSRAASTGNAPCSAGSPHFVGMFTL